MPKRVVLPVQLDLPGEKAFAEFHAGTEEAKQEASTTMAFARLVRNLMKDKSIGSRVVPIIPDEARTFGMDPFFSQFKIYSPQGQNYQPVDADFVLSYKEAVDGQILEEGITEAGAMASFTAAGTSYATNGEPMLPLYIFYSMFGFQRVGDSIWSFADNRGRGFLLGATAGRTTLNGEGLQHQDGHSLLLAATVPSCRAYDPAYAYEMAVIVEEGMRRMLDNSEDIFYYLTLYNEAYVMPRHARGGEGGYPQGPLPGQSLQRGITRSVSNCSAPARSCARRSGPRRFSPKNSRYRPTSGASPATASCGGTPWTVNGTPACTPTRRPARPTSPNSWARLRGR